MTVLHAYLRLRHVDPQVVRDAAEATREPVIDAWIAAAHQLNRHPERITTGCMVEGFDKGDLEAWHRRFEEVVLVREREQAGTGFADTEEYGKVAVEVGAPIMQKSLSEQLNRLGFTVAERQGKQGEWILFGSPESQLLPLPVINALQDMGWIVERSDQTGDYVLSTEAQ